MMPAELKRYEHKNHLYRQKYMICLYDEQDEHLIEMFDNIHDYAAAHHKSIERCYSELSHLFSGRITKHKFNDQMVKVHFIEVEDNEN